MDRPVPRHEARVLVSVQGHLRRQAGDHRGEEDGSGAKTIDTKIEKIASSTASYQSVINSLLVIQHFSNCLHAMILQ